MAGIQKNSQAVISFEIFCIWEMEESNEFSDCVVLNSLTREKGDTKEFRLVLLEKGEERHKKNSGG